MINSCCCGGGGGVDGRLIGLTGQENREKEFFSASQQTLETKFELCVSSLKPGSSFSNSGHCSVCLCLLKKNFFLYFCAILKQPLLEQQPKQHVKQQGIIIVEQAQR